MFSLNKLYMINSLENGATEGQIFKETESESEVNERDLNLLQIKVLSQSFTRLTLTYSCFLCQNFAVWQDVILEYIAMQFPIISKIFGHFNLSRETPIQLYHLFCCTAA